MNETCQKFIMKFLKFGEQNKTPIYVSVASESPGQSLPRLLFSQLANCDVSVGKLLFHRPLITMTMTPLLILTLGWLSHKL